MPEGVAVGGQATTRVVDNPRGTPGFEWPQELPWSEIGDDFIEAWGHDDKGQMAAEHMEVAGQSGSGKSYLIGTLLQQRAQRWGTAEIGIVTKSTDDSLPLLGWPEVASFSELRDYRQCLFWPQTTAQDEAREKHHEERVYELLSKLWPQPGERADVVVYMDEVRYLEKLSRRLRAKVRMYWREGRSHGISLIAGAQRPVEMVRDQHSEARWKAVFPPADEADMERFAQLLGRHQDWEPVLRSLDQEMHQFVLRNTFTKEVFITWIDRDLKPVPSQADQKNKAVPDHISGGRARHNRRGDEK